MISHELDLVSVFTAALNINNKRLRDFYHGARFGEFLGFIVISLETTIALIKDKQSSDPLEIQILFSVYVSLTMEY